MARNRFESYISSQYTPQFVATPLDTNLMYNVLKERQGAYDQLNAQLANLSPNFKYITPSNYDAGHIEEAQNIKSYFQDKSAEINQLLQDDNLSGAQTALMRAAYDPEIRKRIHGLETAYTANEAELKRIESIKDPYHRQLAERYYYQNRLKNKPFDNFIGGQSGPLNSALIGDDIKVTDKIKSIATSIKADGYPIGDGRVLRESLSPNGSKTFMLYSQDGTKEIVPLKEAQAIISTAIYNDPEVQQWASFRDAVGAPVNEQVDNLINAFAHAVSYSKTDLTTKMHDDWYSKKLYEDQLNTPQGMRPTVPFDNPLGQFDSKKEGSPDIYSGKMEIRNGKMGMWKPTGATNTQAPIFGVGPASNSPQLKFEPISEEQLNNSIGNIKKYTLQDSNGNVNVIYSTEAPNNPDMEIKAVDNLNSDEKFKFYEQHYKSTRQTTGYYQPFSSNVSQKPVNNLSDYNIGPEAQIRKDDGTNTTLSKIKKEFGDDVKIFQSGITATNLGSDVKPGKIVLTVTDKNGVNIGEIYSNEEYGNGKYTELFNGAQKINEFESNPDKSEEIIQIGNSFYLAKKHINAFQNNNDIMFDNQSIQTTYHPIDNSLYNFESEKQANKYLKENKDSSAQIVTKDNFKTANGMREKLFENIK